MSLGLQRGTVKLLLYDAEWRVEFEREKQLLLQAFGNKIVAIEHIGSTALPGAYAKPIIDINVAIRSLDEAPEFINILEERLGYTNIPNRRFDDRYFLPKGPEECRTHHLNLVEQQCDTAWLYPLLFRDYLAAHPADLAAYSVLKRELAEQYKHARDQYTEAKSDFVRKIIQKALVDRSIY